MPTNGGLIGKENLPLQQGRTKITEITSSANFTISPNNTTATADAVLVVAAGGGSQANGGNGGAGAGGFRLLGNHPLPASAVPVTIGAGGAASATLGESGAEGANSVFGSASNPITSTGGGGGATFSFSSCFSTAYADLNGRFVVLFDLASAFLVDCFI